MSTTNTSPAANILTAALGHMRDRAATYDKPEGERSMGATVDAFLAVTGVSMTEEQGWLFMALLKAVRSQQGAYRADSYEDGAAYFALAGESAVRDRNGGWTDKAIKDAALPTAFGQQNMIDPADVEIASEIDDDSERMQAIGQNGNGGEHYDYERPSFEFAPAWAKWTAQDADGTWYWFHAKPQPYINGWATDRRHVEITQPVRMPNKEWASTLAARPIK